MAERLFNNGRFEFIGTLSHGDEPVKTQRLGKDGTSNWFKTRMSVGVKDEANINYLSLEYIHEETLKSVKLLSKEDNKTMLSVPANETTLQSTLDMVADFTKTDIDLETDFEKKDQYIKLSFKINAIQRKINEGTATDEDKTKIEEYKTQYNELCQNRVTFCHTKDVISFLNGSLPALKGLKVKIRGNVKSNMYNGKNRLQYIPTSIEVVPNDTPNKETLFLDVFYDKDSIDDDVKEKTVFVNGWIGEKIKGEEKLYPIQVIIDYTKIDLDNDQHKLLLNALKGTFKITDKKQVHKMGLEIKAVNGAETKEFDETCLTDEQRLQIQVGLATLEQFKPRGNVYGERKVELKVLKGDYKNFPDGAVEVFAIKELGDYLASDDSDVKASDIKKTDETSKEVKENQPQESAEDLMAKLFG